jgi:outer membrane protein OmpA-like peptidoglycan-associated protein
MRGVLNGLTIALSAGLALSGCSWKESATSNQRSVANVSQERAAASDVSVTAEVASKELSVVPPSSGFDPSEVPVVNPQLGKFPYFGLIEGYKRTGRGGDKDVDFDQYEFFDGKKIIKVEGQLTTLEAEGHTASAFQVFKTYESLVKELGGVKVFEGTAEELQPLHLEYSDMRHRHPVYSTDQIGVYMLRTPESEIWVEAYINPNRRGPYHLTVVEKKALDVKASLLPAERMKQELDEKGHVALYINFEFNRADIRPESRPIVDEIVKLLKKNPTLVLSVEGHTDDVGSTDYNQSLSDARAKSVVAAIVAQGVEARRLDALGYGEGKPIADNGSDAGRAQNRRVELVKIT